MQCRENATQKTRGRFETGAAQAATRRVLRAAVMVGIACAFSVPAAFASAPTLSFEDPAGDDFGPGSYVYPTDAAHKPGSYDLRKVTVASKGSSVELIIELGAKITDPWYSKGWADPGNGFSLQMVQVYFDTKPSVGHTAALPGVNAQFAKKDAWDKVVLVSPQGTSRLKRELKQKAGKMATNVVIPRKVTVRGKTLVVTVRRGDLGGVPTTDWGVQVVVMGSEGFPKKADILARAVNVLPGQHRFGGGHDDACDPNVIDVLAGSAKGEAAEADAQKAMLTYTCGPAGDAVAPATLPMIRRKATGAAPPASKP